MTVETSPTTSLVDFALGKVAFRSARGANSGIDHRQVANRVYPIKEPINGRIDLVRLFKLKEVSGARDLFHDEARAECAEALDVRGENALNEKDRYIAPRRCRGLVVGDEALPA